MRYMLTRLPALLLCVIFGIGACSTACGDIIGASETFGASLLAISNDAGQSSVVQQGNMTFGTPGQMTDSVQTNLNVTTSQTLVSTGVWDISMSFETVSGTMISAGSTINSDEINAWSIYVGDTTHSVDSLALLQSVQLDSAVATWFDGTTVVYQETDVISQFNGDQNSISGRVTVNAGAGGNVGSFDSANDLATFGINRLVVDFQVSATAVPEPMMPGLLLSVLVFARRRRQI
ncbi:MAG: hypothetical protein AB8B55_13310 [Mariniblastus sp.]